MLLVDWWLSVNVDTLVCEMEKQKSVNRRTTSVIGKGNTNTKIVDRPN